MISFEGVGKIFCRTPSLSKRYALVDFFRSRPPEAPLRRGEFHALRNVSFTVGKGEALWLVGPEKSGKTTVAKLACGVYSPDSGSIRRQGAIRMVGGINLRMAGDMRLTEGTGFALSLMGASSGDLPRLREKLLDMMGLAGRGSDRLQDVSDRVSLKQVRKLILSAAALCMDAGVYVFDERWTKKEGRVPAGVLREAAEILKTRTILISSDTPKPPSDRITKAALFKEGQILWQGPPEEVETKFAELIGSPKKAETDEADDLDDDEEDMDDAV